jgi:UDP-N-acetylglucosamine:LPS N-acetylglucosamine transferase
MNHDLQTTDNRPLILVALCGGGWHRETYRIIERLPADEFRFAYAYGHHSGVHGAASLPVPHPGPCLPIHYLGPTRAGRWDFIRNSVRLAASCIEALRIVWRLNPRAVIVVGSATAIPLFLAAASRGVACVFVESVTRAERLSLTGRIVHALGLAQRLYVQWRPLAERVGGTRFAGCVL